MLELCGDLNLAPESVDAYSGTDVLWKHLDDDVPLELLVEREEHAAHASAAELALDVVVGQTVVESLDELVSHAWIGVARLPMPRSTLYIVYKRRQNLISICSHTRLKISSQHGRSGSLASFTPSLRAERRRSDDGAKCHAGRRAARNDSLPPNGSPPRTAAGAGKCLYHRARARWRRHEPGVRRRGSRARTQGGGEGI